MPKSQEDGLPALHLISLTQRDDDAAAVPLNDVQLVDRPGLQILQASWHPGSDVHFAVLGSDNVFRLYHIDDLSAPVSCATYHVLSSKRLANTLQQSIIMCAACLRMQEQQVELRLRERQPLGLTDMEGSQAAAFAFGSLHMWCVSISTQGWVIVSQATVGQYGDLDSASAQGAVFSDVRVCRWEDLCAGALCALW